MPTECSAELFDFGTVEGRAVEAAFDGGLVSSDAGALLLGATDRAINLLDRFASCFHDERRPDLIEHEVATLVGQRVFGIALGYEDLNDHDELRHDPMMAVLAGKLTARREDVRAGRRQVDAQPAGAEQACAFALPQDQPQSGGDRASSGRRVPGGACERLPGRSFSTSMRPMTRCTASRRGGSFTATTIAIAICRSTCSAAAHLLVAKLRSAAMDAASGAVEEVARVVAHIRARWPRRASCCAPTSGFAREDLMAWCETNGVDFLFGLAQNPRLIAEIATELDFVAAKSRRTGKMERRFKSLTISIRSGRQGGLLFGAFHTLNSPIAQLTELSTRSEFIAQ